MSLALPMWSGPSRVGGGTQAGPVRADDQGVVDVAAVLRWLNDDVDPLAHARQRIVRNLSALAAAMLAVFSLASVWDGYVGPAGLGALLTLALGGNAWAIQRHRAPVVPFWVLACALIAGAMAALALRGLPALFWACPVLFIICFTLPRRLAKLLAVVLIVGLGLGAGQQAGWSMGLRVMLALTLILGMLVSVFECVADMQAALVAQADTDPLTGALNRRQLQQHLESALALRAGSAGQHAVLAIDIDHFKLINDRHGHDIGDEVLRRLVATVNGRSRRGDQLFRVGGEEFLLLLGEVGSQDALATAEVLRQHLAQADLLPDQSVTVSIGVAMPGDCRTAQDWIRRADRALYAAKRGGRDRVVMAQEAQEGREADEAQEELA